jgi:hypothetical protein
MFRISMMAALAAITLSSATAYAQSGAPPALADVARQTAAKWATGKKATKVYTNASLATAAEDASSAGTVSVATATPPTTASAPASQAANASAVTTADDNAATDAISKDENHWRNQAATVRADLARARATLDKQKQGTPQHEQAQRSVGFFQKRWDSLVEAARTAKVPPEWLEGR